MGRRRSSASRWQAGLSWAAFVVVVWGMVGDPWLASVLKISRYSSPVTFWLPFLLLLGALNAPWLCVRRRQISVILERRIQGFGQFSLILTRLGRLFAP